MAQLSDQPECVGILREPVGEPTGRGRVVYPQITTVDSLTAQKRLVEAGFGIALMPRRNVSDEQTRGTLRLVEIGSVEAQLPIVLVRCRGGPQENDLEAFVATLQDQMPALFDN